MPVLALFGITNDGLNLAVNVLVLCLVFIYLALVAWTFFDARRRIDDSVLVGCSVVLSLLPIAGPIIYSILRPPEFLEDQRERELEIRASELRVRQLEESSCPNCAFPIERSYLRCPSCRARVKDPCESCGKPIDPRWALCPYCEAPNRQSAAPPQQRRAPREARQAPSRQAAAATGAGTRRRKPSEASRKPAEGARKPASSRKAPASRSASAKRPASRQSSQRSSGATVESPAAKPPPDDAPAGDGEQPSRPAKT